MTKKTHARYLGIAILAYGAAVLGIFLVRGSLGTGDFLYGVLAASGAYIGFLFAEKRKKIQG